MPSRLPSRRPFLPASRSVLALTASTPRDFQFSQRILQARCFAYRTPSPSSPELKYTSFPRTQLIFRHSSPTPPTRSLRNPIDRSSARTTLDQRSYFHTRNKEIISKMAAQGKKFLHLQTLPRRSSTNSFVTLQRNRTATTCAIILNSHPYASFIPSNLTNPAIYLPPPKTNTAQKPPTPTPGSSTRTPNGAARWPKRTPPSSSASQRANPHRSSGSAVPTPAAQKPPS